MTMGDTRVIGRADLHIHSATGDGVASVQEIMDYVEEHTDLDLIAITDHDEIMGAYESRELAARYNYRFEVVIGMEVTTLDGHLIGLFLERPVRMLQSLEKTIEAIHEQGGVCIVPHPMSWLTLSVGRRVLKRIMTRTGDCGMIYLDGIEMLNPSIAGRVAYQQARQFNEAVLGLPEVGGSDSHNLPLIGTAYTLFEGRTAADFKLSLVEKKTKAAGRFWTAEDHLRGMASQQFKSLVIHPGQKVSKVINGIWGQGK
ncbi:MAG: PHP domain-containing protein [Chloroflexi bacterium]|nr:PHP domain-containing protein [Chloroflexota bacterium]MCL5075139.1 PHP domain-containing protein [Chloroflexota bacterium]